MLTSMLLSATLALLPSVPHTASHAHAPDPGAPAVVVVHATADGLQVTPRIVPAGRITFRVDTDNPDGGTGVLLLRPTSDATLDDVYADFRDMFSEDLQTVAAGTRSLTRDAQFYGLADVIPGSPVSVTQTLDVGTYTLIDGAHLADPTPPTTALRVFSDPRRRQPGEPAAAQPRARIIMTSHDTFTGPRVLPADGPILVRNASRTLHLMYMWPVAPGTTDRQVQAWLDNGANPEPGFFLDGPTAGLNILSPGRHAQLTYHLPAGTYLLLCELPDPTTGIPHVFEGMHKIVTLE